MLLEHFLKCTKNKVANTHFELFSDKLHHIYIDRIGHFDHFFDNFCSLENGKKSEYKNTRIREFISLKAQYKNSNENHTIKSWFDRQSPKAKHKVIKIISQAE